jgi:hypothetical protein
VPRGQLALPGPSQKRPAMKAREEVRSKRAKTTKEPVLLNAGVSDDESKQVLSNDHPKANRNPSVPEKTSKTTSASIRVLRSNNTSAPLTSSRRQPRSTRQSLIRADDGEAIDSNNEGGTVTKEAARSKDA